MSYCHVKSWRHGERSIKWLVVTGHPFGDIRLEMAEGESKREVLTRDYAARIIWGRFTSGLSIDDSCRIMLDH